MVRLVTSQCEEPVTLGSLLVNVTNHDTLPLALTVNVVLLVVRVLSAVEVALVGVFGSSCPLTAEPEVLAVISDREVLVRRQSLEPL